VYKNIQLSLLMSAVAGLSACGGTDAPAPALTAIACTAPDPAVDLSTNRLYIGACIPGSGGVSKRTDVRLGSNYVNEYGVNYSASADCTGASTVTYGYYPRTNVGTTTLASFASDGATPITGMGYQISVSPITYGTGTFNIGSTATFALCKSAPTATSRTVTDASANPVTFTPTFSIRLSQPNTTQIVAPSALDELTIGYWYE
jgi:hypothetical protein